MTHFESTLPRRSREELEQLAAEFVNSRIHPKPAAPRVPKAVLAGGGAVAVAALLAWLLWPEAETVVAHETPAQVAEAEAWARRLEAERERKRRELQSSRDYLAKMAASDSALLAEMTSRAQALATRAAAEPAPAAARAAEPTPRTEPPNPQPAPVRTEAARAEPPPATAQPVAAAPAPQQAAPVTAPVQVAQAAPASCRIHVSELSSSGKLTYADIGRMKGATTDERGHVFTPPVTAANGRRVVFEVMPDGCVRVARR